MRYRTLAQTALIASAFAGSVAFAFVSEAHFLKRDARATADQWAETFSLQGRQIDNILQGNGLSGRDWALFNALAEAGNVNSVRVFDERGALVLASDQGRHRAREPLSMVAPQKAAEILKGQAHTVLDRDHRASSTFSDTYVPILAESPAPEVERTPTQRGFGLGRGTMGEPSQTSPFNPVRGVVGVRIDQSETAILYRKRTWSTVGISAVLAFLAILHTFHASRLIGTLRRSEARVKHMAHHDTLTDLANRSQFNEALSEAFAEEQKDDVHVAVHMIDLDGFKAVNDTQGHDAGDAVLRMVSERLVATARETDIVARLGGDEFALIQRDVTTVEQAKRLGDRLSERVRDIREIDGVPVAVGASVGTAVAPLHAHDADTLVKCADIALYAAKDAGKNRCEVFTSGMEEVLKERNALRELLFKAIEEDGFALHFQPLHNAQNGVLCSFEALVRLPDGESGLVSPGRFIPLAEELGLTTKLGNWVLRKACSTAVLWPDHLRVSVNLSPQQFEGDVVAVVKDVLAESGLAPNRLELEITEGLFLNETPNVLDQLNALKAIGVRIAMDDFGTGYSSLSYLWQFPFDKLKVDRSCFQSLGRNDDVAEVLRTIISMGHAMNLCVTAEGIETLEQQDFAAEAGYDELQGFLLGKPMPETDLAAYILNARNGGGVGAAETEGGRRIAS